MKAIFLFSIFLLSTTTMNAQLLESIVNNYESYKEGSIKDRRFKHSDIEPLILELRKHSDFNVKEEGKSIEGRSIYSIQWGEGPVDILMWSQMHGNEPTATMAIFDIFNFLESEDASEFKSRIWDKVTLTFIPMLNPDGAEKFQRRNALGIDLNRDALRLQSPESNILKNKRDELDAEFGFNLHDQGRNYSVGVSGKQATISFLAPAYNYEKEMNEVRENSMKLISQLIEELNQYIPGRIAKYSDEFEPRAFGDNIQKWGTSLILIESGGYPGDREKQEIRKVNFAALLFSFMSIAEGEYKNQSIRQYEELPFNERFFFDVLIRNVTIEREGKEYTIDIGINHNEISTNSAKNFYLSGIISEIGDLSVYRGYNEIDGNGMKAVEGKVSDENKGAMKLLKEGVLFSRSKSIGPLRLNHLKKDNPPRMNFQLGNRANFVLLQEGVPRYSILNGFIIDLESENPVGYGIELR